MIFILKLFYHYFLQVPNQARKTKVTCSSVIPGTRRIVMKLRERLKVSSQDFLCLGDLFPYMQLFLSL